MKAQEWQLLNKKKNLIVGKEKTNNNGNGIFN
jgi:hypothetical protein